MTQTSPTAPSPTGPAINGQPVKVQRAPDANRADSSADQAGQQRTKRDRRGRAAGWLALALPLVLTNGTAIGFQIAWGIDALTLPLVGAAGLALAVETIAVYLGYMALQAMLANEASLRLRLGSLAFGAAIGALQWTHWHGVDGKDGAAILAAAASAISPWLWAIYSRARARERLRALGLVDQRAVRFSPLRWVLFPRQTYRAFRLAVWAGTVSPAEAIAALDATRDDADEALIRTVHLEAGRILGTGKAITRDALATAVRARGLSLSTSRASELAKQINEGL